MTTVGFIFFILKWFEFIALFLSGKALETTKTRKEYWRIALIPIIVFALVEGLRWGRLIDWNNALVEYNELNSFITEQQQSNPLYTIILYSLKCLGFSFPFFVVLQCGFLFFSALFLLQDYKQYLRWVLPCLLIAFVNNENFIRFYFSVSFVFIAIYFYLNGSFKKYISFSVISVLVHFAQLPFVLLFPLVKFLNKKQFPEYICIVVYVVLLFFSNVSQMTFLVRASDYIVSVFGLESDYSLFSRLSSMDDIINGSAYGTEGRLFVRSWSNMVANVLLYVPLLLLAPACLKNAKYGNLVYNLTAINLILTALLGQAELLHRFPMTFNIFVVISFASVIVSNINKKGLFILIYMMLFLYFYAFLNAPFVREDYMMYFLWDSNGAATNYMPYYNF